MSADDHLGPQFVDVYHATDDIRGARKADPLFVSTHDSPYLAEFGGSRMHLKVPASSLHRDEAEHLERQSQWAGPLFMPGEKHYELRGGVKPGYVRGTWNNYER